MFSIQSSGESCPTPLDLNSRMYLLTSPWTRRPMNSSAACFVLQAYLILLLPACDLGMQGHDLVAEHGDGGAATRRYDLRPILEMPAQEGLGRRICNIGDIDGDKQDDIAVSAIMFGGDGRGSVHILSGSTGVTLATISGPAPQGATNGDGFGEAIALVGDVDGDGTLDLAIGAPWASGDVGYVEVFSICTLRSIRKFSGVRGSRMLFGKTICRVGDVDCDGYNDIAVCCSAPDGTRMTVVISGQRGEELYTLAGGFSLARIRDIDGDRTDDIVVGDPVGDSDPSRGSTTRARSGCARVYSGRSGELIRTLSGRRYPRPTSRQWDTLEHGESSDCFGSWVAALPDSDGDGLEEIVVGAQTGIVSTSFSKERLSYLRVVSGRTGDVLSDIDNVIGSGSVMMDDMISCGDVDGDGIEDLVVALRSEKKSYVRVYGSARKRAIARDVAFEGSKRPKALASGGIGPGGHVVVFVGSDSAEANTRSAVYRISFH